MADDSFLRLGGDSIKAMRLVAVARNQGLAFTVIDVLEHPYLCDLATMAGDSDNGDTTAIAPFALLTCIGPLEARAVAAMSFGVPEDTIEDVFPCTPLQEGLIELTAKQGEANVLPQVFELYQDTDFNRFEETLHCIISAVPVFRTRIIELEKKGLVQVVLSTETCTSLLKEIDLDRYLNYDTKQGMGLGNPLVRLGLIEDYRQGEKFFVWTLHHALCDGWSIPLILKMLQNAYQGQKLSTVPPFQQFVSYISKETNRQSMDSFWKQQTQQLEAELFPALPFPSYQPRANGTIEYLISNVVWEDKDVTLSTALRAVWSILIACYTNSDDVVFGATVNGRQISVPGVERMIGPTIATVPIRVALDWQKTLRQLLQQLQQQATNMIPFEQAGLQHIRRINDDAQRAGQFQPLLVVQPEDEIIFDQQFNQMPFKSQVEKHVQDNSFESLSLFNPYALMLECQLQPKRDILLRLNYDSNILNAEQVQRIGHQMEHLLSQACDDGLLKRKLSQLDLLNVEDQHTIWRWNGTVPESSEICVHNLIVETARQQLSASAVCAWDGALTYGELNEYSTRLAHHLVQLGVGDGSIVPLFFPKSLW